MRVRWMILVLATAVLGLLGTAWGQWNPDTPKLFEAVGDSAGSRLGIGVAGIGDQNGDGYDDIIAGAIRDRKVYLYYGGSPMDAVPDMVFKGVGEDEIVGRLSYAGDVNGDGVGDFMAQVQYNNWEIAKIYVYLGGSLLDTIPDVVLVGDEGIGSSFSTAGDINGDGYDDVIASAVPYENCQGKVYIFFGGPDMDSIPDWTVVGDTAWSYFGEHITGGGDLNGDGYDDVVITGVRGWLPIPHPYMYLRGYYGGQEMDTIPDFELGWTEAASIVGDVNGDGYADIVSRAVDTTEHPKGSWEKAAGYGAIEDTADTCHGAYIFYGGQQMDTIPDVCLRSGIPWLYSPGWPYSPAGDVNRDGYADVISGNKGGFGGFGCVLIYLGGRNMDGKLDVGFQGLYSSSYPGCGDAVGRAGDVNGDGIDDILFGATGLSWPDEYSEGKVLVFSGDTSWSYVREERRGVRLPRGVELGQNWPNPFNSTTVIRYELRIMNSPARTTLKVYNILGEEVRTLVDKRQKGGRYEVSWDGRDERGREVGSGIYFYRLKVLGDRLKVTRTRKMVLIR